MLLDIELANSLICQDSRNLDCMYLMASKKEIMPITVVAM